MESQEQDISIQDRKAKTRQKPKHYFYNKNKGRYVKHNIADENLCEINFIIFYVHDYKNVPAAKIFWCKV